MIVVDASVVVAALADAGPIGRWAEAVLESDYLAAPHHMPVEVANALHRLVLTGAITRDSAALSHRDLSRIRVELIPYGSVEARAWDLRENLTLYDAWYVALAEAVGCEMATLDARLTRAPGLRCRFLVPPGR